MNHIKHLAQVQWCYEKMQDRITPCGTTNELQLKIARNAMFNIFKNAFSEELAELGLTTEFEYSGGEKV